MKLYLLTQNQNNGYDTYDSIVVAAKNEEAARLIKPESGDWGRAFPSWADKPEQVTVELLGTAKPGTAPGIILASFNAG